MEAPKKTPGKRSSDRTIYRNKSYNKFRAGHLRYNEFDTIDFVDTYGREYKFNEISKGNAEPRQYDEPPKFLTDKFNIQNFGKITNPNFGTISLSIRLPTRKKDFERVDFPRANNKIIHLFSPETGAICMGRVNQVSSGNGTKTALIVMKRFEFVGRLDSEEEFLEFVNSIK